MGLLKLMQHIHTTAKTKPEMYNVGENKARNAVTSNPRSTKMQKRRTN